MNDVLRAELEALTFKERLAAVFRDIAAIAEGLLE